MAVKNIAYWEDRYGQICWRRDHQQSILNQMDRDMQECKNEIHKLKLKDKSLIKPSDCH